MCSFLPPSCDSTARRTCGSAGTKRPDAAGGAARAAVPSPRSRRPGPASQSLGNCQLLTYCTRTLHSESIVRGPAVISGLIAAFSARLLQPVHISLSPIHIRKTLSKLRRNTVFLKPVSWGSVASVPVASFSRVRTQTPNANAHFLPVCVCV